MNTIRIITAVARPFRAFPRGTYTFCVDDDGTVRVWDSVANHYTTCHGLSVHSQQRIRKLAAYGKGDIT
jgi:hypothetical protein